MPKWPRLLHRIGRVGLDWSPENLLSGLHLLADELVLADWRCPSGHCLLPGSRLPQEQYSFLEYDRRLQRK